MLDRSCNSYGSLFIKFDSEFLNARETRFTKLSSLIDASQNFLRGCSGHRYAQFTFTSDYYITIVRQVTLEPSPPSIGRHHRVAPTTDPRPTISF